MALTKNEVVLHVAVVRTSLGRRGWARDLLKGNSNSLAVGVDERKCQLCKL